MGFLIDILTFFMILNCVLLVLLVLIQLPKKEAGAGLAFGGGASDALFGAGSGTVLTKITRWAATAFFVLAVVLAMMQKHYYSSGTSQFERSLSQPGRPMVPAVPPSRPTAPPAQAPLNASNMLLMPTPEATNAPAAPSASSTPTNQAAH